MNLIIRGEANNKAKCNLCSWAFRSFIESIKAFALFLRSSWYFSFISLVFTRSINCVLFSTNVPILPAKGVLLIPPIVNKFWVFCCLGANLLLSFLTGLATIINRLLSNFFIRKKWYFQVYIFRIKIIQKYLDELPGCYSCLPYDTHLSNKSLYFMSFIIVLEFFILVLNYFVRNYSKKLLIY